MATTGKHVLVFGGAAGSSPSTRGRRVTPAASTRGGRQASAGLARPPPKENGTQEEEPSDATWRYSQDATTDREGTAQMMQALKLSMMAQAPEELPQQPPQMPQPQQFREPFPNGDGQQGQPPMLPPPFAFVPPTSAAYVLHNNLPFRVNVGGRVFEMLPSTVNEYPESPLAALFRDEQGTLSDVFFDRDPLAFEIVLGFMRTGKVYRPEAISTDLLRDEAMFWGVAAAMFPDNNEHASYRKAFKFSLTSSNARFSLMLLPHEGLSIKSVEGDGMLLLDVLSLEREPTVTGATVYDSMLSLAAGQPALGLAVGSQVFPGGRIYELYGKPAAGRAYGSKDSTAEMTMSVLCDKVYYFQAGDQVSK